MRKDVNKKIHKSEKCIISNLVNIRIRTILNTYKNQLKYTQNEIKLITKEIL